MMHIITRSTLVALSTLAIAAAPRPAEAATPNYAVEANAGTSTMPGSGYTYSGYLAGQVAVDVVNDPPALQWIHNLNQVLFSDAAAHSWAEIGSIAAHAYSLAERVQATNFPPGVKSTTMGRFVDRIHVVSDTLPNGTPVTLTFRHDLSVDSEGWGLNDGSAGCSLQVAGSSSSVSWSVLEGVVTAGPSSKLLEVKTTVGSTLSVSARLDVWARASFFVPGPRYNGELAVDASCATPLVGVSGDVRVEAESGVDYSVL